MENRSNIEKIASDFSLVERELMRVPDLDAEVDICKSDKKIILSKEVVDEMIKAQNNTLECGNSRGFFIYGKEISPGIVVFFKTTQNDFILNPIGFGCNGKTYEELKVKYNIDIRNIKDLEMLYNKGIIEVSDINDFIDISLMGSSSLYEVLSEALYRELPNGEKAIDSVIHFHTHNNISEYSTDYSLKDLLTYSFLFPSILNSLDEINERSDIKFYGTLMCPQRENRTEGIVKLSTIESTKDNEVEDLSFEFDMVPMYQLSNDGTKLEKLNSRLLYKYTTYPDNLLERVDNGRYTEDITYTEEGKDCLNKIKTYVKKIK